MFDIIEIRKVYVISSSQAFIDWYISNETEIVKINTYIIEKDTININY